MSSLASIWAKSRNRPGDPRGELLTEHLVATREVTAVDVVEAALQRIEQLNGTINAVVTLNERAVDEARAVDCRIANGDVPLLCGLPAGIKDVTPVAALRTTVPWRTVAVSVSKPFL